MKEHRHGIGLWERARADLEFKLLIWDVRSVSVLYRKADWRSDSPLWLVHTRMNNHEYSTYAVLMCCDNVVFQALLL